MTQRRGRHLGLFVLVVYSVVYCCLGSGVLGPERACSPELAISILTGMPQCKPRETLVPVPQLLDPRLFQVVPEVVSVSRCSGTCNQGNQYHECMAVSTRVTTHQVMVQRLNNTGHLYSTCSTVEIEEHESCACGCRISQADCRHNQYFSANLCRCECTDRAAMSNCFLSDRGRGQKMWDPVNCRCRCAETFSECSTGYVYDQTETCGCVPELRPASSVPVVALVVALIGTLTCLVLLLFNYRRTKKLLLAIQTEQRALSRAKEDPGAHAHAADRDLERVGLKDAD